MMTRSELRNRHTEYLTEYSAVSALWPLLRLLVVLGSGFVLAGRLFAAGQVLLPASVALLTLLLAVPAYSWKRGTQIRLVAETYQPVCSGCHAPFHVWLAMGTGRCSQCGEVIVSDAPDVLRGQGVAPPAAETTGKEFGRRLAKCRGYLALGRLVWIATYFAIIGAAMLAGELRAKLPPANQNAVFVLMNVGTPAVALAWYFVPGLLARRLKQAYAVECPHCRAPLMGALKPTSVAHVRNEQDSPGSPWTGATHCCFRCGAVVFDDTPAADLRRQPACVPLRCDFAPRLTEYTIAKDRHEGRGAVLSSLVVVGLIVGSAMLILAVARAAGWRQELTDCVLALIAGAIIVGGVAWYFWWPYWQGMRFNPYCPACRQPLEVHSQLVAATGRCGWCGVKVMSDNPVDAVDEATIPSR